jgi:hypothetical protein
MFWKRCLRRRNSRREAPIKLTGLLVLVVLFNCPVSRADKVSELQAHFDKEAHATTKIRILDKLAEAQFEVASKADTDGDYVTVGLTFEKYRDNIRVAFELLRKQEPDAERHPGGYRQLELQARKGIREVEQTIIVVAPELRPPLEIVHKDLLATDDELIQLLFPKHLKGPVKVPPPAEEKP